MRSLDAQDVTLGEVGGVVVVGGMVVGATVVEVVRGGKAAFLPLGPELHPAAISPASAMAPNATARFEFSRMALTSDHKHEALCVNLQ